MFEKGDIIKIKNTSRAGVVYDVKDDNNTAAVDLYFDGDRYITDRRRIEINLSEIDYLQWDDNDIRTGYLKYISGTVKNKNLFTGGGRTPERIDMILALLKELWVKYPDMRLGQLLTACSANNLFYMEDDKLADEIVKFMER